MILKSLQCRCDPNGITQWYDFFKMRQSEANLVLPLAGADITAIVKNDLQRARIFATKVNSKYSWVERNSVKNGLRWFFNNGAGDYLGRPDTPLSPTVRMYNEVNDVTGMGAVGTWFGVPVRVAKASDFIVGFACKIIGVSPFNAWISQILGSRNDGSAKKSWDAGWKLGKGEAFYDKLGPTLVKDIFDEGDEKNMNLWPNPNPATNHYPGKVYVNPNTQFISPGFLEMKKP